MKLAELENHNAVEEEQFLKEWKAVLDNGEEVNIYVSEQDFQGEFGPLSELEDLQTGDFWILDGELVEKERVVEVFASEYALKI